MLLEHQGKAQSAAEDYTFHSVFVYSFSRYIEWPQESMEFRIGVVGGSLKLEESLEKMAASKSNDSRKYIIKTIFNPEEAKNFHMLIFPNDHISLFEKYQKQYEGKAVLMITEGDAMMEKGAAINFVRVDQKLQYEISQTQIELRGMKVSSRLVNMGYQK